MKEIMFGFVYVAILIWLESFIWNYFMGKWYCVALYTTVMLAGISSVLIVLIKRLNKL